MNDNSTRKVILNTFDEAESFEQLQKIASNAAKIIRDSIAENKYLVGQGDVLTIITAYKNHKLNTQNADPVELMTIVQEEFKFDNIPLSDEELEFFGISVPA